MLRPRPGFRPAMHGNREEKAHENSARDRIESVDEGKPEARHEKPTGGRSDNTGDLEEAGIPGDCICEYTARNQVRDERCACRPPERPDDAVEKQEGEEEWDFRAEHRPLFTQADCERLKEAAAPGEERQR